ncbi:MAG: hypothetical protein C0183_14515, partial [Roseiflexus castenholzii]
LRALAPALRAVAPFLAIRDTATLAHHAPHLLPGLVWARTAWYWGVAEGVEGMHSYGYTCKSAMTGLGKSII